MRLSEGGGPSEGRANDIIAGNAPRAVCNHLRSSFPDPALIARKRINRHCQKEHFPSLRNHRGPAARALGVLYGCYLQLIDMVTSGICPALEISAPLVGRVAHPCQTRGTDEPGSLIEAASTVSGTSITTEPMSAVRTSKKLAIFPHSSAPSTMAPKNTIWWTAMPRARM